MVWRGEDLIRTFESWCPQELAAEWDRSRIGLQVGDPRTEVTGVMVTLDVTEEVVDEALACGANWIVAHHAPLFHSLKAVRTDEPTGRLMQKLIKHDLQVYVAHTNLDVVEGGVNDALAERLGLRDTRVFLPERYEPLYKLVVFVPQDYRDQVFKSISEEGAGWIGNYSHCSFHLDGTGTFLPRAGSNPFIGTTGEVERVPEVRIETIVAKKKVESVVQAMIEAHPYEEVAYDLYPLKQKGSAQGLGRVGSLAKKMTLPQLAEHCKQVFQLPAVRIVGKQDRIIQTVAVVGGSGSQFYPQAHGLGVDAYITGDIGFHDAQEAERLGLSLVDVGHHVEHWVVPKVIAKLTDLIGEGVIPFYSASAHTEPFRFV
ncbi:Nif3-like dinuclear metal center hexameric protein [Mechercharimyces sp. CAU 1602]|uniref:Nif3-like dinuclear metal center hexameric protein n=1 Tax=Mechercharimyces sp. CAU 1602 TaxID=2973933 RepID=UPI002162F9C8|nr:Nif3-like dinuclear metal center hexameric protein [Mechercharimyces sp. CAU 1602]MCS1350496.1 Nif3-like dinuclear metal center hexameric protein [Mechercharimyces sp. CAU 1602]